MKTIKPAPVRRSVEVKASVERAFDVFTNGFGSWWPHSHTISKGKLRTAVIEPRVGGRWYGEDEDGTTTQWGHVLVFERPNHLVLAWQISSDWQFDPAVMSEVELRFTPLAASLTLVQLEHRHLERLGPKFEEMRAAFESPNGWGAIMGLFATAVESDQTGEPTHQGRGA
ncbi:MAG: SRPBCC family protein [Hyphomicrobiales bacterium]|nr:SRPBCC family protein [Hyphomicrobiales bacterium]